MTPLLFALPWLALLAFVVLVVREPRELPDRPVAAEAEPLVSVVVPARDEAATIETCLRSLTRSAYGAFEVIVVDDRSSDETAEIASSVPRGNAQRVLVVAGEELVV